MIQTLLRALSALLLSGALLTPTLALAQSADGNAAANATVSTPVAGVSAGATVSAKVTAAKAKAAKEIDRRTAALSELSTRIQAMQKVSDAFKQSLNASVQGQVSALSTLKAKIDAETDAATIKTDIQSITASYRIFALFMPQARIAAMADREVTVANMFAALGTKLQARLVAAQNAGGNVSALTLALTDLGTKIADANTQAQAAVSASATLTPDQGDKAKMASNTAALKAARANLSTSQQDLVAARKDVQTILDGLKKLNTSASTSAAASSTTTAATEQQAQ